MQTTPLSTGPCDSQRVRAQRGRQNLRTGESEPGDFCPCREPPHRWGPSGWDWAAGLGQGVGSRGRSPACPRPGRAPADTVRAGPARPDRWRARPPSPTSFRFRTFQTTQDDVFKRPFIKGCECVIFIKTSVLRPNIVERMIHTGGTVFDSSFYSALSLPVIFLYVNKCA